MIKISLVLAIPILLVGCVADPYYDYPRSSNYGYGGGYRYYDHRDRYPPPNHRPPPRPPQGAHPPAWGNNKPRPPEHSQQRPPPPNMQKPKPNSGNIQKPKPPVAKKPNPPSRYDEGGRQPMRR